MIWFARIVGTLLLLLTVLPLMSTGKWYVRWWDFPRLQLAFLLILPLIASFTVLVRRGLFYEPATWCILLVAAIVWQVSHVIPFSPVWPREVENATSSTTGESIKVMVANLKFENNQFQKVKEEIRAEDADVLLLVELDEKWNKELQSLREEFSYHHDVVRGDGLGMAVWSQLPFLQVEEKYLVSKRRVSLWTTLKLNNGQPLNFVGVHPTPPGLKDSTGEQRRDSRVRDAELLILADEIATRDDQAWIVAGDFNDVAWSHTTRLFKRTSGLLDPRVGRCFMGTFSADYPLLRCPIDHIFLSDGFRLKSLSRKRLSGSDHFAVLAEVQLQPAEAGVSPEPEGDDPQDAKAIVDEGIQDAAKRNIAAEKGAQ